MLKIYPPLKNKIVETTAITNKFISTFNFFNSHYFSKGLIISDGGSNKLTKRITHKHLSGSMLNKYNHKKNHQF